MKLSLLGTRKQRQARTYGVFVYVWVNFLVFARRSNVFT